MVNNQLGDVVRYLRRAAGDGCRDESDGQLLRRFVELRDEAAFARLVQRHGAMVLGVGRRVLRDANDVEDVFQATFLVLVRKAGSIRKADSLASWLHGVAHRTALKAKSKVAALGERLPLPDDLLQMEDSPAERHELRRLLDAELHLLPEKYRRPLILCYLEGKTNQQAAHEIGCTKGTVSGRLARARDLLRRRLLRRGLTLTPAALTALLCEQVSAAPAALTVATAQAVTALPAATTSTKALTLAEGVIRTMWMYKVKTILGAVLLMTVATVGSGLLTYHANSGASASVVVRDAVAVHALADEDALLGEWALVSRRQGDKMDTSLTVMTMNVGDTNMSMELRSANGKSIERIFTYFVRAGGGAKQIDLRRVNDEKNLLGIYDVSDNMLTLCLAEEKRPVSFVPDPSANTDLLVFQRIGKKKGKARRAELKRLRDENSQLREQLKQLQDTIKVSREEARRALYQLHLKMARQSHEKANAARQKALAERRLKEAEAARKENLTELALDALRKAQQARQKAEDQAAHQKAIDNARKFFEMAQKQQAKGQKNADVQKAIAAALEWLSRERARQAKQKNEIDSLIEAIMKLQKTQQLKQEQAGALLKLLPHLRKLQQQKQIEKQQKQNQSQEDQNRLDKLNRNSPNPPKFYIKGVIHNVEETEKDLVETSLGSDQGIRVGHTLSMYRTRPHAEYVGMVRIASVSPRSSIGRVVRNGIYASRGIPRVGDVVASRIVPWQSESPMLKENNLELKRNRDLLNSEIREIERKNQENLNSLENHDKEFREHDRQNQELLKQIQKDKERANRSISR